MSCLRSRSHRPSHSLATPRESHSFTFAPPQSVLTPHSKPSPRNRLFKPQSKPSTSAFHRLQTRFKRSSTASQITPELAAKVVKDYLLPLFDRSKQSETTRSRLNTFGLQSLTWDETLDTSHNSEMHTGSESSGLYKELKLSEQMYEEVSRTRMELEALRKRLKEAEQRKESSESELKIELQERLKLQNALKMALFECAENQREMQGFRLKINFITEQLTQSESQQFKLEKKCQVYISSLHEERAKSDIRSIPL